MFDLTQEPTKKLLGVDPGSKHLGLCLIEFDVLFNIVNIATQTINVSSVARKYKDAFLISERFSRLLYMEKILYDFLLANRPEYVIHEDAYYNAFTPGSYSALIECNSMIRSCVYKYNQKVLTTKVKPSVAKKLIGAKGNKGKESIKPQLLKYSKLKDFTTVVESSDEHSCDAISIALSGLNRLEIFNNIQHIEPKSKAKRKVVKKYENSASNLS